MAKMGSRALVDRFARDRGINTYIQTVGKAGKSTDVFIARKWGSR